MLHTLSAHPHSSEYIEASEKKYEMQLKTAMACVSTVAYCVL